MKSLPLKLSIAVVLLMLLSATVMVCIIGNGKPPVTQQQPATPQRTIYDENDPLTLAVMASEQIQNAAYYNKSEGGLLLAKVSAVYFEIGNNARHEEVLHDMKQAFDAEDYIGLRECFYAEAAEIFIDSGNKAIARALLEEAERLAHQEERLDFKASSFVTIANLYKRLGNTSEETKALATATTIWASLESHYWTSVIACEIADSHIEQNRLTEAKELIDEGLKNADLAGTSSDNAKITVAESYAKLGNLDNALSVADTIIDSYWETIALQNIVEICAGQGRLREAIRITNSLTDVRWKSEALIHCAEGYVKIGNKQQALQILQTAVDTARLITDECERAEVFIFVAEALATFAKNTVTPYFEEATKLIGKKWSGIGSLRPRRNLPLAYIAIQDYDGALSVISKLEEPHEKAELVGEFVIALVRDGSVSESEKRKLLDSAHLLLKK